ALDKWAKLRLAVKAQIQHTLCTDGGDYVVQVNAPDVYRHRQTGYVIRRIDRAEVERLATLWSEFDAGIRGPCGNRMELLGAGDQRVDETAIRRHMRARRI